MDWDNPLAGKNPKIDIWGRVPEKEKFFLLGVA